MEETDARLGLTLSKFFHTDDLDHPPIAAHRRALAGHSAEYEIAVAGRDYAIYVEPLRDAGGAIVGCQGLGIDITARKAAEVALRDSEARFRTIFTGAAIGIVISGLDRRIVRANPAYEQLLGYPEAELRAMSFPALTDPAYAAIDGAYFRELVAGERESYQIEKRYRRKDGAQVWGCLTVSLVRDVAGMPRYTIGMVEDITARRAAEAELVSARRRLAAAREEERLALARELHDEAIQELLGIRLALQLGQRALVPATADATLVTLLDEGQQTLQDVVERLRRIIGGLRPAGLEELGLVAAIEGYVAHVRRKEAAVGLAVETDLDPRCATLSPGLARALFRVVQEGLRNVRRHAGASRAGITLRITGETAILCVEDDGCGFVPPDRLHHLANAGHFGLVGLTEQLADFGGTLQVGSRLGLGTKVTARVPLDAGEVGDG